MTQMSPKSNSQNTTSLNSSSSDLVPLEENLAPSPHDLPPFSFPLLDREDVETDGQVSRLLTLEAPEQDWETQGEDSSWQLPGWWQKLSLRVKATSLAVAIGTIPVLAFGTVAYQITNQQLTKDVIYQQQSRAAATNQIVSRFMVERYGDIDILAHLPIFANPQGTSAINSQQKQKTLDQYIKAYGVYDSVAFFDLDGNVKVQSSGKPLDNHRERQYFQEAVKTGKPVISKPEISKSSGELVIHFAAPVFGVETGKMIGVVRSRLPVKYLAEFFQDKAQEAVTGSKNFQSEQVFLADADGRYFVAAEEDELGILAKDDFAIFPQLQADKKLKTEISLDQKKIQQLLTYSPITQIKDLPDLNWSLIVADRAASAFAAQRQLLLAFFLGTGVATLAVAQFAIFLSDRATRPILKAANAVKKIGQGELDTHLVVQGEDELAILGKNINVMTGQIQSLVREQELLVEKANFLAEIASSLVADDSALGKLYQRAIDGSRHLLDADRVTIYRLNADGGGAVAYESLASGWSSAVNQTARDSCLPAHLIDAYRQGRVVAIADTLQASLHTEHAQLLERLQVKALLVVPLINQGNVLGLMIAHYCRQTHAWNEQEISFFKQVAEQLHTISDRLSLQQQRRDDSLRSQMLKDITLKITTAFNIEEVLDIAVQEIRQAISTDRVIVYRFDAKWQGQIIAESVAEKFPVALGANIADPCFAQRYVEKYRQGRVQATNNIYEAGLTECHLKQLEPFAVKANLVAPILRKGELLGLLVCHQCSAPRQWQQAEIDFFTQIATQVGLALERADLLEQQRSAEVEQRQAKEQLQQRALELLLEVDPVSRGDLTIRANVTEDEIGTIADSYNATIENLRRIVNQVQGAAGQMASTTTENEAAIRSLSVESIRQAENVTEALGQIKVMTVAIRAVANNAEQAEAAVQKTTQTVELGEEAMNRTVDGIMAIRETVAETAKKVKRLGESSQKISKVVNLISSFADQTNLLALNASIEAAHAGEEGRGFAVVADEVRSLARQSATASAEIETLVASIQSETNEVVAAMEAGTEQVVVGTKLVDETRKSLNQITAASAQINELVEAIAKTAIEQSQTSQSVTQTMVQVAANCDKTSSEATQVSDSFKQLLQVAQTLQDSVRQFKIK